MRLSSLLVLPLLLVGLLLSGCDSNDAMMDDDDGGGDDPPLEVPSSYTFESPFVEGESAVAYPGQVTRNLLINDLKFQTDALGQDGASPASNLLARYTQNSQDLGNADLLTPDAFGFETPSSQQSYGDIAADKNLQGVVTSSFAGDVTLIGSADLAITDSEDVTADELIQLYLNRIQTNSQDDARLGTPDVYTTDDGVNMSQMVNKLLLGAASFSQGTAKYLDANIDRENFPNTQDGDNPYSSLGHQWDEAFGYYGAARSFSSGDYYDGNGMIANAADQNGDGVVDLNSEFVYTWADYSVDRGTVNDIGFHTELFRLFREGRTAIVNGESIDDIRSIASQARAEWEKVVAANVIHYMNSMESDLSDLSDDQTVTRENLGPDGVLAFNEHWGEAKPFAWALQFNSTTELTNEQLDAIHAELGSAPPYGEQKSDVIARINAAKQVFQDAYGFPDANMNDW